MLQVIDMNFNDHDLSWEPDSPLEVDEWITVNVGENGAGNYYQVHLCTGVTIKRLNKKHNLFMLEKWEGIESLVEKLNVFIEEKLNENVKDDPYQHLSNYWSWEFEGYDPNPSPIR